MGVLSAAFMEGLTVHMGIEGGNTRGREKVQRWVLLSLLSDTRRRRGRGPGTLGTRATLKRATQ